ncbi:MAG: histidine kinase, partial [Alistipes sp.]|nr:histidine kinase [Alistipes sp.]
TYIDQLSYAFRYILQNSQSMLVKLDDELRFAEAYSYLFKTRYADKLFFEFKIDDSVRGYLLPSLTLQPLMGNAVKHNTITRSQPLCVTIRTEGEYLIIENPNRPKLSPEPGTGIGLENLNNRWELITGNPIEIISTEEKFMVKLHLQKK